MKTPMNSRRLTSKLLNAALMLILATSLGACGGGDDLAGPSPATETETDTDPAPPTTYEVRVNLSHFKIVADCDPGITQGDGEFEYTIEIWGKATTTYNRVRKYTGSFTRGNGETYGLSRTVTFRLPAGGKYYVSVKATEKDGFLNGDDYLGYKYATNDVGGRLDSNHELRIGGGTCKLTLYYSARETPLD